MTDLRLLDFWKNIPFGSEKPDFYKYRLVRKHILEWPEGLESTIKKEHGELKRGFSWDCVDLPDTDCNVVTVRRVVSDSDVTHVSGITQDGSTYAWQYGLSEVDGIYFFHRNRQELISLEDIIMQITNKRVRLYVYGDKANLESPVVMYLNDEEGQYDAVFVHEITKLEDVLDLFHELGHILVDSKSLSKFKSERAIIAENYRRDVKEASDELAKYGEDIPVDVGKQIREKFLLSDGFQQRTDLSMRLEVDAWSAALFLLDQLGILSAFEKGDEKLSHYMLHSVKTRIPL